MNWLDKLTVLANVKRAERIEAALLHAGLELRKLDNRPANLGVKASIALAAALDKMEAWR